MLAEDNPTNLCPKQFMYIVIGAKLGGSGAPAVFWSRSLVLLNKSRILILHPHFSGPFGANDHFI